MLSIAQDTSLLEPRHERGSYFVISGITVQVQAIRSWYDASYAAYKRPRHFRHRSDSSRNVALLPNLPFPLSGIRASAVWILPGRLTHPAGRSWVHQIQFHESTLAKQLSQCLLAEGIMSTIEATMRDIYTARDRPRSLHNLQIQRRVWAQICRVQP